MLSTCYTHFIFFCGLFWCIMEHLGGSRRGVEAFWDYYICSVSVSMSSNIWYLSYWLNANAILQSNRRSCNSSWVKCSSYVIWLLYSVLGSMIIIGFFSFSRRFRRNPIMNILNITFNNNNRWHKIPHKTAYKQT